MKKRCIAVVLFWVFFVSLLLPFSQNSYAVGDPLTANVISGALYSLMSSWGIVFSTTDATAQGTSGIFNQLVNDYCDFKGGNLSDIFYGKIIVDAAGKLVIGQQIYNTAIDFVNWMKDRFTGNGITLGEDSTGYIYAGTNTGDSGIPGGYTIYFSNKNTFDWGDGYDRVFYSNGTTSGTIAQGNTSYTYTDEWSYDSIDVRYNRILVKLHSVYKSDGRTRSYPQGAIPLGDTTLTNIMNWDNSSYIEPTILNPDKEWTGTIGGQAIPDTNLDELIGQIFQDVADNNLDVDGEIIDVPVPPGPVPTWTPVDNVIDGINQTGEILDGIGNDIGNISGHLDDIGDQIDDVTGALEGVQEGINTQTGVISGALDQAAQDVVDAIGEQTATLDQTLTDTAESVQDIAEALKPGQITTRQFDLRRLFPFCIPFDIHNLLQKFDAEPVAPHVQLPFVIQSIGFSYMIDLDFSAFDSVAAVLRTVEFIVFAIGLAWATSKVIKW